MEQLIAAGLVKVGDHSLYPRRTALWAWLGLEAHPEYDYSVGAWEEPRLVPHSYPSLTAWSRRERGFAGRKHALRVLEENYSRGKNAANPAEFKKSIKRKYKDGRCQSPRFVLGDQPPARDGYADEEGASPAKRVCRHHRRFADDALRDQVLRTLGGCLIAEWLTPLDMYHMKCAVRLDWSWARVWHHGRVKQL